MQPSSALKKIPRAAGVLLHPTSLYTPYGIGDLGASAKRFVDFLKAAGQSFWQILPLGPTGYGDSPYQTLSAFAGNPLLISPDRLVEVNLLSAKALEDRSQKFPQPKRLATCLKINFDEVQLWKDQLFQLAFSSFKSSGFKSSHKNYTRSAFRRFCERQASWLDKYVLFLTLKTHHQLRAWIEWDPEYKLRNPSAINNWEKQNERDLEFYRFIQWLFSVQWDEIHQYANQNGVEIIGDVPIFVAHDSADVWADPEFYTINSKGSLEYQAGVPPDYFSKTGQLWGNPLYRWDKMEGTNFHWFVQRFRHIFNLVDWIRIDHFRGFEAYWKIPGTAKTAINGEWVESPGKELFLEVQRQLGVLPIIAEDLGIITKEVEALRDFFNFPGMKVLQFAFGSDETNPHLPHNYVPNSIVYSGTHDNDTTSGWWETKASQLEKQCFMDYFNSDGTDVVLHAIKGLYRSNANLVVIPMQDVLRQGSEARMNTPSVPEGNWQYQLDSNSFDGKQPNVLPLAHLTKLYRRRRIK